MGYRNIPKEFLSSSYRKELWKNAQRILRRIEKVLPVAQAHLMGSFVSRKKRPADVDFMILVRTSANKGKNWSLDLVIVPDNKHGREVLEDNKKWVRQRYGSKSGHFQWR